MRGVWSDIAVSVDPDGKPVADRNRAVIAAARNARRAALLLPAADAGRKGVVGGHVIELRGRLVVPGAPGLTAVQRDDGPLIGRQQHDVGVFGFEPAILIILAARCTLERQPALAAVRGLPRDRVGEGG